MLNKNPSYKEILGFAIPLMLGLMTMALVTVIDTKLLFMNKSALEYHSISKLLHWIIALLLLISIPTAYYMSGLLDENNMKWTLYEKNNIVTAD